MAGIDIKWEKLRSPFTPSRTRHPRIFQQLFDHIQYTPKLNHSEKRVLKSLISHTPNEKLFLNFRILNGTRLKILHDLAVAALKNLRNALSRSSSVSDTSGTQSPTVTETNYPTSPQDLHVTEAQALELLRLFEMKDDDIKLPTENSAGDAEFAQLCIERERFMCLVTSFDSAFSCHVAHIFPFSCLNLANMINGLTWQFLILFLGEENRSLLISKVFTEDNNIHSPQNGLTLLLALHNFYDMGAFCLVPVKRSIGAYTGYFLEVKYTLYADIDALTATVSLTPEDPNDQCQLDPQGFPIIRNKLQVKEKRDLEHGDRIRISTPDPEIMPLPSQTLLFWQELFWNLWGDCGLGTAASDRTDAEGFESSRTRKTSPPKGKRRMTQEEDGAWDEEMSNRRRQAVKSVAVWCESVRQSRV
ncbi:hypothetical protein H072_6058 [Dactylellina haptotyla CBS 200.50]|uniref:HNH nuclease domain-containing protein n=1 Tax=Dactylellina haptotyla (strain CBS 200.50) TaxID=1284197 RepID=S8BL38_DACHA|nr:hypothetical protein H072_6058 [Dactylellina haptotyla CBS 200.50]